jgi:hypothetical protein
LEYYTVPSDLDELQDSLEYYTQSKSQQKDTEFYWYYTKGKYKEQYEKITKSEIAPEFLSKTELFP